MSDISTVLSGIKTKVEKLGNENESLRSTIKLMESEKADLLAKIEAQERGIEELKEAERALRIARSVGDTDEKSSDIKVKINGLVREIDKCIALLNN